MRITGWIVVSAGLLWASQVVAGQPVTARRTPEAIEVKVAGKLFTRYILCKQEKYPFFFPVIGPATGESVTGCRLQPYPHHSSLFFGCDRVSGGNYWQEGLDRGQIVPLETVVVEAGDKRVVIEQRCRWQRPGAPAPFEDQRRIIITAPSPDRRYIDFQITLKPLIQVHIERSNHALFSARMAPDLSVNGGGILRNASGERGEKATFGKVSPWMDYAGKRGDTVEGLAILSHPTNPWHPPRWFTRDYGFFSPTPMNWLPKEGLRLAPGENLRLRYLAVVHAGELSDQQLNDLLARWAKEASTP